MRTLDTRVYELLPKLKHLTLTGVDGDGNLDWTGTDKQWGEAMFEEEYYIEKGRFFVEVDDYDNAQE